MAATRIDESEIKLIDCECPIGYEELKVPATTQKGYTYELKNIQKHFDIYSKEPLSNEDNQDQCCILNDNLAALILAYNRYATKPKLLASMISKIYTCPLTKKIMRDPVIAEDGCSYEKEAIEIWFKEFKLESPLGEEIESTSLRPNRALKNNIEAHEKFLHAYLKSEAPPTKEVGDEMKRASGSAHMDMQSARVSYKRGMLLKEHENFLEAITHFKICLSISPQHRKARFHMAECLFKLEHHIEALNTYLVCLELDPLSYDNREQCIRVYNALGEWRKAHEEFELLASIQDEDLEKTSHLLLSQILFRIGNYEEAEQNYKEFIDTLKPTEHENYLNAFIGRAQALIRCSEKIFLQYKRNLDITTDIVRKASHFSQIEEKHLNIKKKDWQFSRMFNPLKQKILPR